MSAPDDPQGRDGKWSWYWNRLRCMSAGEMLFRGRRLIVARLERYGVVGAGQVPRAESGGEGTWVLPERGTLDAAAYAAAADAVMSGHWRVFALERAYDGVAPDWNRDPKTGVRAPFSYGKAIDYRDASLVGDIKYLWEINRHLQLVTVAQAYFLTGELRYGAWIRTQLESWFAQCPYPKGVNWASALEAGIRLINWSFVWRLAGGAQSALFQGVGGPGFRDQWLASVYLHARFIRYNFSEYSSANNHLIGECAGLFVASVTWPCWDAVKSWGALARERLSAEALRQNGTDGVNREQAMAYQQFVLDFLIIAGLLGEAEGKAFPEPYWRRVEAMLEFIASIMDAGGNVPMIGDADDGYVVRLSREPTFCPYRSLLATGAVLFGRGDFKAKAGRLDDKTRWLLGARAEAFNTLRAAPENLPVRRAFPEGGYYVLGSDFETAREVRMVVDAGPLGYHTIAAHGHADALSFTLSLGGREFLMDPGTYAYHTERRWRDYFRGTAAHNTARIDGQDQSVIGGSFLWLTHAQARCEAWGIGAEEDHFSGCHNGYTRLRDPVLHRREVRYHKPSRRFRITDSFACNGEHRVELFWHFSETCAISRKDHTFLITHGGQRMVMRPPDGDITAVIARGDERLPAGWISRRFDVKRPTATMIWSIRITGPTTLTTEIDCLLPEEPVNDNEKQVGEDTARSN